MHASKTVILSWRLSGIDMLSTELLISDTTVVTAAYIEQINA